MEIVENRRIEKTKEEKEAFKAQKKLAKDSRKQKTLQKEDKPHTSLLKDAKKIISITEVNKVHAIVEHTGNVPNNEIVLKKTIPSEKLFVDKVFKGSSKSAKCKPSGKWFSNLFQPDHRQTFIETISNDHTSQIHSAFIELGRQIDKGVAHGSTMRCQLFLNATKQMVNGISLGANKDVLRIVDDMFDSNIEFLRECRPLPATVNTAIKYIKSNLMRMTETNDEKCKKMIVDVIDQFSLERIDTAQKTIVELVSKHIKIGTSLLVYSYSQLVLQSILYACNTGLMDKFQIFVVETYHNNDNDKMIAQLREENISFTKVRLSSVVAIINKIDLVMLGAHSVLSNNSVISRVGSASIANIAHLHRKPVVICAETYKFYTPNQTESCEYNELADPDRLITNLLSGVRSRDGACNLVENWRKDTLVTPIDLLYDVIPHTMITMICCELGTISPTTSSFVTHLKQPVDV